MAIGRIQRKTLQFSFALFALLNLGVTSVSAEEIDAKKLVDRAIEYWRGVTSYMVADMLVHRSDWERRSSMHAWTSGKDKSLVRFTAPKKDKGNASLTVDNDIWSFSPKVNRVIKIPPSMKAQSWMGSDFSYQDLSKSDDIIDEYQHRLLRTEEHEGKKVYVVEAIPLEAAPVVWGKEILRIREDYIILEHRFYDQDLKLVKRLRAKEIKELGGRLYASHIRMEKLEAENEWTEVRYHSAEFGLKLPDSLFSLSNLRNPRRLK